MKNVLKDFFKPDPMIRDWKVYVISQGNKYYVGITSRKNPQKRIGEHGTKKGAAWTSLYKEKPKRVIEVRRLGKIPRWQAENIENDITHEYMRRHGNKNVRGGYNVSIRSIFLRQYNPGSVQDVLQILLIAAVFGAVIILAVH